MSNKTFTADKIKTNQICGIDGGSVTICGIDNDEFNNFPTISGGTISGNNLLVSGDGDSLATFNSGVFNELVVNGVKYVPRNQIAYGFYFGGPPIDVPERGPLVTATGFDFTDASDSNHSISGAGVSHTTAQAKFGSTSMFFDGDDDRLVIPEHSDFALGTGQFTIEMWYYKTDMPTPASEQQGLISKGSPGSDAASSYAKGDFGITYSASGTVSTHRLAPNNWNGRYSIETLSIGQWHHIAVVREGTGINEVKLYLNGSLATVDGQDISESSDGWTWTGSMWDSIYPVYIGYSEYTSGVDTHYDLNGYLEDVRISTTARYSGNFTPNSSPFTNDSDTVLLVQSEGIDTASTNHHYSGLVSNTNRVFVESTGSFVATGDHVVIGGLYDESENQEIHTVTGFTNYYPTNCCNSKVFADRSIGLNRIYYHEENEVIAVGDNIRINEDTTVYTVTNSYNVGSDVKYVDVTPNLTSGYKSGECICITPATLLLDSNLSNDYTSGTKVAKKYASGDACFDTSHLYLEKAMYKNETFDWNMTGYRETFIDFSGVQVHITGQSTSGLLTLQYPEI